MRIARVFLLWVAFARVAAVATVRGLMVVVVVVRLKGGSRKTSSPPFDGNRRCVPHSDNDDRCQSINRWMDGWMDGWIDEEKERRWGGGVKKKKMAQQASAEKMWRARAARLISKIGSPVRDGRERYV
jgi:hypothetical protein